MKKLLMILAPLCLLFAFVPATQVFAAGTGNGVTITVVLPGNEPETPAEPTPHPVPAITLYPVDVTETREHGGRQIIKTYELTTLENPADIPRESFERNGWLYTLTDILKRETANAEMRTHTETVTLDTDTKELEQILALLAPTIEYRAEDDFVGLLYLDVASIKVETAGTRTTSYEMKVTREYPRLSTNDTEQVPKTVTENGKTYNLAGVDWVVGNYSTVDYERIPDYYTAVATYTATGTSTKVTGYVTTAEYNGNLAKLTQGKTVYTAYFIGTEIRTPLEMVNPTPEPAAIPTPTPEPTPESTPEPTPEPTVEPAEDEPPEPTEIPADEPDEEPSDEPEDDPAAAPVSGDGKDAALNTIIALLSLLLGLMMGGAFYYYKTRKGLTNYEKNIDTAADDDDDDVDSDARSGG